MIYVEDYENIKENVIDQIVTLILSTKQVQTDERLLRKLLRRSYKIGYKLVDDIVCCTVTIKTPTIEYKEKLFPSHKMYGAQHLYNLEIGYGVTHSEHKGKGYFKEILDMLVKQLPNNYSYATTKHDQIVKMMIGKGFYLKTLVGSDVKLLIKRKIIQKMENSVNKFQQYFRKYDSIANPNNAVTLQFYREQGYSNLPHYATEKVHGSNLQAISDGTDVEWFSRELHLPKGEALQQHKGLWDTLAFYNLEEKVKALSQIMGQVVTVNGEYYAGDNSIVGTAGIKYREDGRKGFIAFDVYLPEVKIFVEYPRNFELLQEVGIDHVHVYNDELTWEEMMTMNNEVESELAKKHGLNGVQAEGIVLKPKNNMIDDNNKRVAIKRPAVAFVETKAKGKEKVVAAVGLTEEETDIVQRSMTLQRLGAKFGATYTTNEQALLNELKTTFANDIMQEHGIDASKLPAVIKLTGGFVVKNLFKK